MTRSLAKPLSLPVHQDPWSQQWNQQGRRLDTHRIEDLFCRRWRKGIVRDGRDEHLSTTDKARPL